MFKKSPICSRFQLLTKLNRVKSALYTLFLHDYSWLRVENWQFWPEKEQPNNAAVPVLVALVQSGRCQLSKSFVSHKNFKPYLLLSFRSGAMLPLFIACRCGRLWASMARCNARMMLLVVPGVRGCRGCLSPIRINAAHSFIVKPCPDPVRLRSVCNCMRSM